MPFDVQGARQAGYSDAEIAEELGKDSNFDVAGARAGGYSDAEIISELDAREPTASEVPAQQPVDSPERRALVEQLRQRIGAADAAGERLQREESIAGAVRPVLQGLTVAADATPIVAIPRLLGNFGAEASNRALGTQIPQIPSITPPSLAPRNTAERFSTAITGGVSGAAGGIGVGQQLLGAGSQAVRNIGGALAANPGLQAASAVSGATSGEIAREAGAGPLGQFAANLAGSFLPGAALGAANKLATGATRTQEAQRLLDRGVDLTPGQLNPGGRVNQIEEGTQSIGLVGPTIAAGRQNARDTFQRAAIQEAAAPGAAIKQSQPAQMLDDAYESFRPLYDAAKGFPASAQIVNQGASVPLSSALRRAVRNGGILATDEQRKAVLNFLKSQLTKGVNSSDDLLDIRSSVRDAGRKALKANNTERADLLAAADEQMTLALQSQLPPTALQSLKVADSKYGDYKIVEGAVARAKDRGGSFTPNDLSEAVAAANQGALRGSYARGGGGPLRELASDARTVLDARSPPTGARVLALAPGAAVGAVTGDPLSAAVAQGVATGGVVLGAGTQTGRRLAAGTTAPQQFLRSAISQQFPDVPLAVRQQIISGLARQPSQLSPTAQVVRDMIGVPAGTPPSPFLGLEQQQEQDLRARLYP